MKKFLSVLLSVTTLLGAMFWLWFMVAVYNFVRPTRYEAPPVALATDAQFRALPGQLLIDRCVYNHYSLFGFHPRRDGLWTPSQQTWTEPTDKAWEAARLRYYNRKEDPTRCPTGDYELVFPRYQEAGRGIRVRDAATGKGYELTPYSFMYWYTWSLQCDYLLYTQQAVSQELYFRGRFPDGEHLWVMVLNLKTQERFMLFDYPYRANTKVLWFE